MIAEFLFTSPVLLSEEADESWFELIVNAIKESFTLELGEYQHISIETGIFSGIGGIIIAIFIGMIIAAFMSFFGTRAPSEFVKALINEGCNTPENAKTLQELGFLKRSSIKSSLKSSGGLARTVRCVQKDKYTHDAELCRLVHEARASESGKKCLPFSLAEYKFDFQTDRFYIPEENSISAEMKFGKKGGNWLQMLIFIFITIVVLFLVIRFLPDLLQMLDNFIDMLGIFDRKY